MTKDLIGLLSYFLVSAACLNFSVLCFGEMRKAQIPKDVLLFLDGTYLLFIYLSPRFCYCPPPLVWVWIEFSSERIRCIRDHDATRERKLDRQLGLHRKAFKIYSEFAFAFRYIYGVGVNQNDVYDPLTARFKRNTIISFAQTRTWVEWRVGFRDKWKASATEIYLFCSVSSIFFNIRLPA